MQGGGRQYVGPRLEKALNVAWEEAQRLKDEYCSTEHLLIGIAQERTGAAARILAAQGVTPDSIYRALVEVRGSQRVTDAESGGEVPGPPALLQGPHRVGPHRKARPGDRQG